MENKDLNMAARELGRKGGLKTKAKYGPDYYKKISKKALKKRWGKKA